MCTPQWHCEELYIFIYIWIHLLPNVWDAQQTLTATCTVHSSQSTHYLHYDSRIYSKYHKVSFGTLPKVICPLNRVVYNMYKYFLLYIYIHTSIYRYSIICSFPCCIKQIFRISECFLVYIRVVYMFMCVVY